MVAEATPSADGVGETGLLCKYTGLRWSRFGDPGLLCMFSIGLRLSDLIVMGAGTVHSGEEIGYTGSL